MITDPRGWRLVYEVTIIHSLNFWTWNLHSMENRVRFAWYQWKMVQFQLLSFQNKQHLCRKFQCLEGHSCQHKACISQCDDRQIIGDPWATVQNNRYLWIDECINEFQDNYCKLMGISQQRYHFNTKHFSPCPSDRTLKPSNWAVI